MISPLPHRWVRVLTSIAFFLGGAITVIWAQGFRLDCLFDGEESGCSLVSTGVVSVSSTPSQAAVFIDGSFRGISPEFFLSIPIGEVEVCLLRSGYHQFCAKEQADPELVTFFENIHLVPKNPTPQVVANTANISWDPQERGFIKRFPEVSELLIFDNGEVRFLDTAWHPSDDIRNSLPEIVSLSYKGDLLFDDFSSKSLFFSEPFPKKYLRSFQGKVLSMEGNRLFLHLPKKMKKNEIAHFSSPIEDAFFLPDSESMLIILPSEIFLLPHQGVSPSLLFSKDAHTKVFFFSGSQSVFWQEEGNIYGYSFSE